MNGIQETQTCEDVQNANPIIGIGKGRPRIWTREKILTKISEIYKNGIVSSHGCGPERREIRKEIKPCFSERHLIGLKASYTTLNI